MVLLLAIMFIVSPFVAAWRAGVELGNERDFIYWLVTLDRTLQLALAAFCVTGVGMLPIAALLIRGGQ
jgi:hypothetical protein